VAILWSLCLEARKTAVSISSRSNFSARPAPYVSAFLPIDGGRSTIALYVLSGFLGSLPITSARLAVLREIVD
jgi:hypothetical protein